MKKILALLFAYLIVYFMTSGTLYPYADISVKVSYINGSVSINPGQKGTLSIKDDSLVFHFVSEHNKEVRKRYRPSRKIGCPCRMIALKSLEKEPPIV